MGNISKANLLDKDIRALPLKEKQYIKSVGNPKELYIWVNPNGIKSFCIRIDENGKTKHIKLKEFREGIYSVAEARRDANKMLKELQSGKELDVIKGKSDKCLYGALFDEYIKEKRRKVRTESTITKVVQRHQNYILPSLSKRNIREIKYDYIYKIIEPIYNPNNPATSRLDTLHRLINDIANVFDLAMRKDYIESHKIRLLHQSFDTARNFKMKNNIDSREKAIIDTDLLREFIRDLKNSNSLNPFTKRALYLQILTGNRPINTASAKWAYIDFDKKTWDIPFGEMKNCVAHTIALSNQALQILKEQFMYSGDEVFVFPAQTESGHIHRDTLSKAIRNLNDKKYKGLATAHGFRATFRTFCHINEAKLLEIGVSLETAEACLSHQIRSQVVKAYVRQRATLDQKAIIMQWYADFLDSIEPLF